MKLLNNELLELELDGRKIRIRRNDLRILCQKWSRMMGSVKIAEDQASESGEWKLLPEKLIAGVKD